MTTIYDVAKRAGVSYAAVSAVLNNRNNQVSKETRQRILEAVCELDYRPSRVARQLATGRFDTIAVRFDQAEYQGLASRMMNPVVAGISAAAAEAGQFVLFAPVSSRIGFVEIVKNLPSYGVDGAIIVGPICINKATMDAVDECSLPVVCIDSYPYLKRASTVDIDNAKATKQGVEHLISLGFQRILFIGANCNFQCHIDRLHSFNVTMQTHGLQPSLGEHLLETAKLPDYLRTQLGPGSKRTALFCSSREHALAAWNIVHEIGLHVPDDVAMFVFDGLQDGHPGANLVCRIGISPFELGVKATEVLVKLIAGTVNPPVSIRLVPDIVPVTNWRDGNEF